MKREIWNGITVLTADEGAYITNKETYTDKAYLSIGADESAWRDATAEEYEEWQRQQEEPEPTEKEALTRYSNELTGEQDGTLTEATETLIKKLWRNEK